jgi:hypothetical protein
LSKRKLMATRTKKAALAARGKRKKRKPALSSPSVADPVPEDQADHLPPPAPEAVEMECQVQKAKPAAEDPLADLKERINVATCDATRLTKAAVVSQYRLGQLLAQGRHLLGEEWPAWVQTELALSREDAESTMRFVEEHPDIDLRMVPSNSVPWAEAVQTLSNTTDSANYSPKTAPPPRENPSTAKQPPGCRKAPSPRPQPARADRVRPSSTEATAPARMRAVVTGQQPSQPAAAAVEELGRTMSQRVARAVQLRRENPGATDSEAQGLLAAATSLDVKATERLWDEHRDLFHAVLSGQRTIREAHLLARAKTKAAKELVA